MKRINSLEDLMLEELADLMDAEIQLAAALPLFARACYSEELKAVMEIHVDATKTHIRRLKDVFSHAGQTPGQVDCKVMRVLISEAGQLIDMRGKGYACDSGMIMVAQRIEHYEITGYAIAQEHADDLGHTKIVGLLDKTLNEERTMHLQLSELAQGLINIQVMNPQDFQGYYALQNSFGRKGFIKKKKGSGSSRYKTRANPARQEEMNNEE